MAAHAEDCGAQAEAGGVVEDVLIGNAFAAAVGRAEFEGAGFADAVGADGGIGGSVGTVLKFYGDVR